MPNIYYTILLLKFTGTLAFYLSYTRNLFSIVMVGLCDGMYMKKIIKKNIGKFGNHETMTWSYFPDNMYLIPVFLQPRKFLELLRRMIEFSGILLEDLWQYKEIQFCLSQKKPFNFLSTWQRMYFSIWSNYWSNLFTIGWNYFWRNMNVQIQSHYIERSRAGNHFLWNRIFGLIMSNFWEQFFHVFWRIFF